MTEKEYNDASNALITWFKSQGIKPSDGTFVMLKLIASQLVAKSDEIAKLQIAINSVRDLLTIEIATELRSK